jgi:hypothetical protein
MTLGVSDELLECALRVPLMRYYNSAGTPKADIEYDMSLHSEPTPASPFVSFFTHLYTFVTNACPKLSSLVLTQPKFSKIMHAALARKGCVVERGIELMSFEQFPDCVNVKLVKRRGEKLVQEEEHYKWVVGADGTAPVMRELLGLQLFGDVTTVQSSIGEIRIDDGLSPNVCHHSLLHSNITHRLPGLQSWHMWGNPPKEK